MSMQEKIRELADDLSDEHAEEVLDYVRWVMSDVDKDPLTEIEKAGIREGKAERRARGGESWEKVKRDLSL